MIRLAETEQAPRGSFSAYTLHRLTQSDDKIGDDIRFRHVPDGLLIYGAANLCSHHLVLVAKFPRSVRAARRVAQDQWPDSSKHLAPGVESHIGPVIDLSFLADNSVDFVFATNLFEHISQNDFASVLAQLRRKLKRQGTLTVLQPNYRYAFREYFDDYTHITPYSHLSICDFLQANSYDVIRCIPRFLPLTLKSCLRVSPILIRLYLLSPIKPLAKMLVQARPKQEAN